MNMANLSQSYRLPQNAKDGNVSYEDSDSDQNTDEFNATDGSHTLD